MRGPKVVFFELENERRFFEDKLGGRCQLFFEPERLNTNNVKLAKDADILVVFVYSDLSHQILDALSKLKGIVTMSVGTDHIDLKETKRRQITVSNVPAYGPNTVAEHAMALLLALSRNIVPSVERTRTGDYDYAGLSGWDLKDKTLGLVGTGKIGQEVARMAHGFQMSLIAYDLNVSQTLVDQYNCRYFSLEQVVAKADVLSLHLPLVAATVNIFNAELFSKMKKGTVLINTARGGLIDPDALLEALENGTVRQCGLDVLPGEGLLREEAEFFSPFFKLKDYQAALAGHALMRHPRVIVTPHNAFNSFESRRNIKETTLKNIESLLAGQPTNLVGPK